MRSLFTRRFREEFHSLLSWSITIFLSGMAIILFGWFFTKNSDLARDFAEMAESMPPFFLQMLGGRDLADFSATFLMGMAFQTIAPLLLLVFSSLAIAGIYTREAGQGTLEFLFSLPVSRFRLIRSRILVFLANLGILHLLFYFGLITGILVMGKTPDYARLAWAAAGLFLFYFALGGLAFLLSLTMNDYSRGILLVLGILLGLFILNLGVADAESALSIPNPYHYLDAAPILRDGAVPWLNYLGFALSGLALWAAGIGIYVRKQI